MTKISKKHLRVGFELEFKSPHLAKKYGKPFWGGSLRISTPVGNIGVDGDNYELRTKPVRAPQAAGLLTEALALIEQFRGKTTSTTGLHINVSCSLKKYHHRIDPLKLWKKLNPKKWARLFGRQKSTFCSSPKSLSPWETFAFAGGLFGDGDRNSAINFLPYGSKPKKSSRIEFRFLGGKNYHRKTKTVLKTLDAILRATSASYR